MGKDRRNGEDRLPKLDYYGGTAVDTTAMATRPAAVEASPSAG